MSATSSSTISTASAPLTLMGVTGQTGGAAVNALLARNDDTIFIRGIVRSHEKGDAWKAKLSEKYGAERINKQVSFAISDQRDIAALTAAFTGSSAVYVMLGPEFPDQAFEQTKQRVAIYTQVLKAAKVNRIVALSSLGGHFERDQLKTGSIYQVHLLEKGLINELSSQAAITAVRPGWFFENSVRLEFPQAKNGKFGSFFSNLDAKYPHVSTKDIGTEIANALVDRTDRKTPLFVELEGPERFSVNDFARIYTKVFGREVTPFVIPEAEWTPIFEGFGIPKGITFIREELFAGYNSGKLVFQNQPEKGTVSVKGKTTLEEGLTELVKKWEAQQATAAATTQKTQ